MATLTTVHSVDHLENMQQRKIVEGSRSPFQVSSAECSEDDENTNIKSNVSVTVNETEASTSTWRVNYEVKGSTPQMERSILDVSIKPIIGDPAEKSREKGEKYKARERKRVLELFEGSDYDFPDDEFPTFKEKELIVGRLLGRGAFCDVLEIPLIRCVENECSKELKRSDSFAVDNAESRLFVAKHCVRECGDARYAMKLPQTTISCSAQYWTSVADLVTETRFLSHLEHPNIIKLRAVADVLDPFTRKYFILIDRLYDTLAARLKKWRLQWKKSSSFVNRIMHRSNRKCHFEERLVAALDLSSALEYIHSKQICHRDIKPENIGFDIRGDIKIFDFGLARYLDLARSDDDGLFDLTMMTGTLRYMAPEVGVGKRYNEACDVYSFAILVWEMLALECPYKPIRSSEHFVERVFGLGQRPPLKKNWSPSCKEMLAEGWCHDPAKRSPIPFVKDRLRKELSAYRGCAADEADNDSLCQRRRSTYVYEFKTSR